MNTEIRGRTASLVIFDEAWDLSEKDKVLVKEPKFLLHNEINTDGDFRYSMQDEEYLICDTEEQIYEYIKLIMTSLLETTSSHKDYLEKKVKYYAESWIKESDPVNWFLPQADFGNQSIGFRFNQISMIDKSYGTVIKNERKQL